MTSVLTNIAASPYVLGLQTAMDHPDPISLEVIGNIPNWVSGALLRTTPARF
jgi:carotenoid cleavage dioxygenase-like enzyme